MSVGLKLLIPLKIIFLALLYLSCYLFSSGLTSNQLCLNGRSRVMGCTHEYRWLLGNGSKCFKKEHGDKLKKLGQEDFICVCVCDPRVAGI